MMVFLSSRTATVLFLIMIYSLAFDFRSGANGEKSIVVIMGLISLLSGMTLVALLNYWSKSVTTLALPAIFFSIGAAFSGIVRGQLIYDVIALTIPIMLFIVALLSVSILRVNENYFRVFLHVIIVFALLSTLFKLIFGFYYYGLTLENSRYQIISPALVLIFSYGVSSVLYKKQKWGVTALALSFLVLFLSITRTYLVVFLAIALFWALSLPLSFWRKKVLLGLKLILFVVFLIMCIYLIFPGVFDRWFVRLFSGIESHGIDVTAVTRIAEVVYQWNKLLDNPYNLYTGMGIAAETKFAPEYREILSAVYSDDFVYTGKGFGHNTYMGIIFTGGIILGSWFIFAILNTLRKAIIFFRSDFKRNKKISDFHFCLAWGSSSALGYSIYGLLGGTFGDRLASMCYGISFGLLFLGKRFIVKNG